MQSAKQAELGRDHWVRRAILLSWFTIIYNFIEGFVSIYFGLGDDSIALAGFGVDSLIEVASAVLILWRFRGEAGLSHALSLDRDKKTTLGIGVIFVILAFVTVTGSLLQLSKSTHPKTTLPGLIISTISLSFMLYLWSSKKRVGTALESRAVLQDASCSLACIKLSLVLFCGSILFLVFPGLWWADSAAALLISALILREGWETVQATRKEDFTGGGCGCD